MTLNKSFFVYIFLFLLIISISFAQQVPTVYLGNTSSGSTSGGTINLNVNLSNSSDYWDNLNNPSDMGTCGTGQYLYGFQSDGSSLCRYDATGGSGEWVNTTDYIIRPTIGRTMVNMSAQDVLANSLNSTNVMYQNGNEVCDDSNNCNLITTDTNATTQCTDSDVPLGNGSCIAISNLGNSSWNESYASSLYYPINTNPNSYYNVSTLPAYPIADNTSWNQSYAETLFYSITNPSNFYNATTLPAYPIADNTSWNESHANTLYAPISLVTNVSSIGNWSADKTGIQTNISSINNLSNSSIISLVNSSIGNWSQDRTNVAFKNQSNNFTLNNTFSNNTTIVIGSANLTVTSNGIYGTYTSGGAIVINSTGTFLTAPSGARISIT